jgi:hypothetical protein
MRLIRRLGRDSNPLRRRSDLIDAWLPVAAIAAFLAMCPLVLVVTGSWIRGDNAAARHAQMSWHPVEAVLLRSVPGPEMSDHGANTWQTWTPARWTAGGRERTADVPAPAGSEAGSTVTVWLDRAGDVHLPPLTLAEAGERVLEVRLSALAMLAVLLAVMTLLGRRILDRRRLAGWEAAWLSVGPTWSRRG